MKSAVQKLPRCPRGTRRHPLTKTCEPLAHRAAGLDIGPPPTPPPPPTKRTDPPLAFLFLTYGNIVHEEAVHTLVRDHRILLHPKYPDQVSPLFRPYIAQTVIPTTWGQPSIVQATIGMIREAYLDPSVQWFVLLSGDVYPMVTEPELRAFLSTQSNSIFHQTEAPVGATWKASQWWILNRRDVRTMVSHWFGEPDSPVIPANPRGVLAAPDETYFLSLLQNLVPAYVFTNMSPVYTQWLAHTIQKSPATFHQITDADLARIRSAGSLFLRKTSPAFLPVPKVAANTLVVVYVGTESGANYDRLLGLAGVDIMVMTAVPLEKIPDALYTRALCVHQILWKFERESIQNLTAVYAEEWDRIVFLSEMFASTELPGMRVRAPARSALPGKFKSPMPFIPRYTKVFDSRNKVAYMYTGTRRQIKSGELVVPRL